jgi:hypothetical protein
MMMTMYLVLVEGVILDHVHPEDIYRYLDLLYPDDVVVQ